MKKGILLFFLSQTFIAATFAAEPLFVDVKIIGAAQSPLFEPQNFEFDAGQDYLLVISNTSSDSITFEYGNFGQKVFTRQIQGTSSMTQQSFVISGNSKVQWHFSPQTSGEYTYHAINTALNSRGNSGKITVKKTEHEVVSRVEANTAEQSTGEPVVDIFASKKKF